MASAFVDSVDDLHQRFHLMGLEGSRKREESLQHVLQTSSFSIFSVVQDLGYWGWTPSGPYKKLEGVTAKEILDQLDVHQTPDELCHSFALIKRTLPRAFATLPPQNHTNKYPHAAPIIAGLHVVSKHRGVDLNKDVDLLFGGSTLQMLAHLSIEPGYQYLVTRVPHHPNVIYVSCFTEYVQDYNQAGFQFERLMTGKQFNDPPAKSQVKHHHILQVGDHRVLFTAEVDASNDGHCVEIKSSNPRYWGTRTMFQMISNGSTIMCHGHKSRDVLRNVQLKTLSSIINDALAVTNVATLERNICHGINMLKREADAKLGTTENQVMELYMEGCGTSTVIKLRPIAGKVLFPSQRTNKELLT